MLGVFCKNPGVTFCKKKWLCKLNALFLRKWLVGGGYQLYYGSLFREEGEGGGFASMLEPFNTDTFRVFQAFPLIYKQRCY